MSENSFALWELRLAARAVRCRLWGRSDYERWTDRQNLSASWNARTERIAGLVPRGSRVLEFGAGQRLLKTYLDASCVYSASDLVGDPSDTLICDLNRKPLPALGPLKFDVAVFSGVLEYVRDLPALTRWLSGQFPLCIASYVCSASHPYSVRRGIDALSRMRHGWVNTYSGTELQSVFEAARFTCVSKLEWREQQIFCFTHAPQPAARPAMRAESQ